MVGAERLLAMLPGVLSASIDGDIDRAAEVRLLVEDDPPVSEILDAVRAALDADAAEFPLGAFFRIQVAPAGDAPPYFPPKMRKDPVASSPATPEDGHIKLMTHRVRDVSPGVLGVELTLGLVGHRFAGGASGQADSKGRNRVPALATLSALGSYIRFASRGGGPTLALESVSEFALGASRVAVVVVTMSGHGAPLIASWPLTGAAAPAVVRATLAATGRRVTRLSTRGDRPPREATEQAQPVEPVEPVEPAEPAEPAGAAGSGETLRQQVESLLESAGPIASARIVLDKVQGFRIHVLATSETSSLEVSRMVMTLLEEGLGLEVRLDQITVAQSRLSAQELDRILRRTSSSRPSTSAEAGTGVRRSLQGASAEASSSVASRHALADVHIVAKMGGKQEVGVRVVGGGGSFNGRCQATGGGVALLRPLAEATLEAVGGLMQGGGRQVALVLKDVRRFRRPGDDGVVVLVEATVDGRKMLSSGAAFSSSSFERASVMAVLQATNAFVDGVPEIRQGDEEDLEAKAVPAGPAVPRTARPLRTPTDSAAPRDPSPEKPSDSTKGSASPKGSDSTKGSDSPEGSASPKGSGSPEGSASNDYVSEVLLRMSTRRLDRAPPP